MDKSTNGLSNFNFTPLDQPSTKQSGSADNDFGFTPLPTEKSSEGENENWLKKTLRTIYAPVSGALNATAYGITTGLWDLLGTAESLNALEELEEPGRIEELKRLFPSAPWENYKGIDREQYLANLEEARGTLPTVSNIEKFVESQTGLPLEALTDYQRYLKTAGSAGKLSPGGSLGKVGSGVAAGTAQAGLEEVGVPKGLAEPLALLGSQVAPRATTVPLTKPSGAPIRRFENLTKETQVTPTQASKIRSSIEEDVRNPIENLIKRESKTARALEEDPQFSQKIDDLFEDVNKLVEDLPQDTLTTGQVQNSIRKRVGSRESKGITSTEAERGYFKELERIQKELTKPDRATTNKQLLEQYRQNNKELGKIYESSKSVAANEGKRDAILDYNRAIADIWEKRYPDSEFNKLFNWTNKRYSEMADLEVIDKYLGKTFGEKTNYKEARKAIHDPKVKKAFTRTLGEEGYKEVKQIVDEFLPTEKYMKLIKEAELFGIKDTVRLATKWFTFKPWGVYQGVKSASKGVQHIKGNMLSSKDFRLKWENALKDFKDRKFRSAFLLAKELDEASKEKP